MNDGYIHGSSAVERQRLALMNSLINPRCLDALALTDELRVLDVGCGTGQFTRAMAARLPSDAGIVAIERNPEQIEAARASAGATGCCSLEFRRGEATALPLGVDERGRFDLAHARFLLEHVPDPLAVVREMVAAVRPGGRIVLLDDDHDVMRFAPDNPALDAAWTAYWHSYRSLGTDPLVGRRLVSLLHQAGAEPLRIDQLFYGACAGDPAFAGVVDNLAEVLRGARAAALAGGEIGPAAYDCAVRDLDALKRCPDGAIWYVINWAEGRRPG